jgi:RNA polymerase sigma factor (sigma-70 family)
MGMGKSRPILDFLHKLARTANQDTPDEQLLKLFHRDGDEDAFAALVQRHGQLVLGVCRRVLKDEHSAEDAFQATFLTLARKGESVRRQASLGCWLYKVAYRLSLRLKTRMDRERSKSKQGENESGNRPGRNPADSEGDLTWREVRAALDDELQHLPEIYRAPLVLCYLAGKTLNEAAELLGWTTGSVKGRLERGRKMLRERLERRGLSFAAALTALALAQEACAAIVPQLVVPTLKVTAELLSGAAATSALSARVLELANLGIHSTSTKTVGILAVISATAALGVTVTLWIAAMAGPVSSKSDALPDTGAPLAAFRDIAEESGLEAIANSTDRENPNWKLASFHAVDFDGDGHLDVFLSSYGTGQSVVALNDGKGRFRLAPGADFLDRGVQLVSDLSGSGRLDFTALTPGGMTEWWVNKSKPGSLEFERTRIIRGGDSARRQTMIDINRDGRADWVRGSKDEIVAELADSSGRFSTTVPLIPAGDVYSAYALLCVPVDLNGDGHIDFLVETGHSTHRKNTGDSRIYLNDGKMGFRDASVECGLPSGIRVAIKGVGDLNQDGYPDLIVFEDKSPEIYLNDGKGRFTKLPGAISGMATAEKPDYTSWGIAAVTDFDNDGIPDLIWNGRHFLWVLRGLGGGRFEYMNDQWGIKDLAASAVDGGLCFGDLDNDGRLDIIGFKSWAGRRPFAVYRNELPNRNWLRVRPIGPNGNIGATGSKIRMYAAGTNELLWYDQIVNYDTEAAQNYYSQVETERHFGLGDRRTVDVEVEFYPSGKRIRVPKVPANTTLRIREETP